MNNDKFILWISTIIILIALICAGIFNKIFESGKHYINTCIKAENELSYVDAVNYIHHNPEYAIFREDNINFLVFFDENNKIVCGNIKDNVPFIPRENDFKMKWGTKKIREKKPEQK